MEDMGTNVKICKTYFNDIRTSHAELCSYENRGNCRKILLQTEWSLESCQHSPGEGR